MRSRLELAHSWSAFTGYLILAGIPLLIALPSSARVDELVTPRLSMSSVFLVIATVLFAAYSLSFGLKGGTIKSVLAHVLFLLVLSLPYWTVFTGIVGHGLDRLLGAPGVSGALWGMLGSPGRAHWEALAYGDRAVPHQVRVAHPCSRHDVLRAAAAQPPFSCSRSGLARAHYTNRGAFYSWAICRLRSS
jgi:hypothetical protein